MQIAKRRNWNENEVDDMIAFIKARRRGFWEQLLDLERRGGDLQNEAGDILSNLIGQAHPDCELSEMTDLKFEIRKRMAREVGPS